MLPATATEQRVCFGQGLSIDGLPAEVPFLPEGLDC